MKHTTIRQTRKRLGWTQEQLAEAAGLKQGYISRLETGEIAEPSFTVVAKIAAALDVDPRVFRFGRQPESMAQ